MEELGIRPGLYCGIYVTQVVKENHGLSIQVSIDEAQENSTAFEEMRVSKFVKVRSDIDHLNWLRTLRWCPRGHQKIEKVVRSGQE